MSQSSFSAPTSGPESYITAAAGLKDGIRLKIGYGEFFSIDDLTRELTTVMELAGEDISSIAISE